MNGQKKKTKTRGDVIGLSKLARKMMKQGKYREAEEKYNLALKLEQDNIYLLVGLGDLNRKRKRFKDALYYYQRALDVEKNNKFALAGMGDAHRALGELDKADELRKRIRNAVFTDERAADHLIKYGDMFPEVLKFFTNREEIKPLIKDIDPIVLQDPETMISWLDTLDQEKYKQR